MRHRVVSLQVARAIVPVSLREQRQLLLLIYPLKKSANNAGLTRAVRPQARLPVLLKREG
jgi:hypothetical protein